MNVELFEEIMKHEHVGQGFNIVCKCGYVGLTVSKRFDFERHLADALIEAGYQKVEA
jgi:hypothetical protein